MLGRTVSSRGSRGRLAFALSLTFAAASPAAAQEGQLGQQGQIWNLGTQETGRRFPTEVTVANKSCRGSHTFSVAIEGIATRFLAITGPTTLAGIRPGQSKSTPARLDLTGIEPGVHDGGRVVIRCLDCPPTCNLDYQFIEIRLTVTGPASATPANDGGGPAATGPAGGAQAAGDPDPDGDCEFVPKLDPIWTGNPAPGEAIVEKNGAFAVDLSPGSALWTISNAAATDSLATRARELCLVNLGPCDELLARVRAAETAARVAQAAAERAAENEKYDRADAAAIDESIAADRAQIEILRRQARDWRELADAARAQAQVNRDRAERHPQYRDSWLAEAAKDEARAAQRDGYAQRLEDEAAQLEAKIRDRSDRADATRGRAEAARREAAAAAEALALARAEYEACLERQRLECENQRRDELLATRARAAAAAAATTASAPSTASTAPPAPPPHSAFPAYSSVPVQTAPYCKWIAYNVPYGASVDSVVVRAASGRDTPSAIEVRKTEGSAATGKGFEFHCKEKSGSAVILFHLIEGDVKKLKLRVGCVEE